MDKAIVDDIRKYSFGVVEVVSKRGIPSRIVPKKDVALRPNAKNTHEPVINVYYPSPEMHEEAAQSLTEFIAEFWGEKVPSRGSQQGARWYNTPLRKRVQQSWNRTIYRVIQLRRQARRVLGRLY